MSKKQETQLVKALLAAHFDIDSESYRDGNGKLSMTPFKAHADGTYTVKESFFYTYGKKAVDVAANVKSALGPAFNVTVIEAVEKWNNWPKTSYWQVRFSVAPR